MKVLYFTDVHIKGATPGGRSDVYYVTILKKLMEIGNVINTEGIDFVVIGGDLFDIPNVSNRIYGLTAKIFKSWKAKVFVVPGNHDVFGQTIESLEHTSLGALESAGVVTLVTRDNSPIYLGKRSEPNNILALNGQEYYDGIDTGKKDDYSIDTVKNGALNLLVVHGFAVNKAFHPSVPHTIISNINTNADLILTGHYHPNRYDLRTANGVQVLKPIGLGRVEATKHNVAHKPEYLIMTIENSQLTHYEFREVQCAPDGKDVFDATVVANSEKKQQQATLASFSQSVTDVKFDDTMTTHDMIRAMAGSVPNVKQEHILNAIQFIMDSEKSISDKDLDGYIPQHKEVNVLEIELNNFQSHKHTVVSLDPTSLNAFIGATHSGKTAAIRALNWVFYNEPKGTDMINQSASKCSVSVRLDNGKKITRYRTKSASGGYKILDEATGIETEYTKFSNNIPVEVFNAHQMPKLTVGKDKISINFGMQLEGPFMLSMTGSERATMIGNITGADIIDEAVAIISSKIINAQKGIKGIESQIEETESKLSKYNDLNDDKEVIEKVNFLVDYIGILDKQYKDYSLMANYIKVNGDKIAEVEAILSNTPDLNRSELLIKEIEDLNNKHSSIVLYQNQYEQVNKEIQDCEKLIDKTGIISKVEKLVNEVADLEITYSKYDRLSAELTAINHQIALINQNKYDNLAECEAIIKELEVLDKMYSNYESLSKEYNVVLNDINNTKVKELYADIDKLVDQFNYYDTLCKLSDSLSATENNIKLTEGNHSKNVKEIERLLASYRSKLKEIGECPICNNVLSNEKIDTITL